jgi:fucose permease
METAMIRFEQVTTVTIASAFVVGMMLVLLVSLRPLLVKRLHISETKVDWLLSALNISLIPMMLISGLLIDRIGVRWVLLVGSLITCIALFDLSLSQGVPGALAAVLMAGAGGACLSTGSTVLMSQAFFQGYEAASQNMGNVFFGLGALLAPALAGLLTERLGYRRLLSLVAIVSLLPALFVALTAPDAFDIPIRPGGLATMVRDPVLWLTGAAFFLYGPLEASLGLWGDGYLKEQGVSGRRAAWLLSGFWLTFLGARLATALSLANDGAMTAMIQNWLIVIMALAAAVALGNLAGTRTRSGTITGVLLIGAFYGPIFPMLVATLFGRFDDHGTAYGAMFAIGATGNLLLQPLIGSYARRSTPRRAVGLLMILALVLALVALILALLVVR